MTTDHPAPWVPSQRDPRERRGVPLRPVLGGDEVGHVPLDGARRLTHVLAAMLDHAVEAGHDDLDSSLDRHSDLFHLTVVTRGCSPECLDRSEEVLRSRSEDGDGDVRWYLRSVPEGLRLDWMLVVGATTVGTRLLRRV